MIIELGTAIIHGIIKLTPCAMTRLWKHYLDKYKGINSIRISFPFSWTWSPIYQEIGKDIVRVRFTFLNGVFIITNCTDSIITIHDIKCDTQHMYMCGKYRDVCIPSGGTARFNIQSSYLFDTLDEINNANITIEYNVRGDNVKTFKFKYQGNVTIR